MPDELDLEAAQLLEDGVDWMDTYGWCQNSYFLADKKACAIGSLGLVQGQDVITHEFVPSAQMAAVHDRAHVAIYLQIRKLVPAFAPLHGVEGWNDDESRTYEEVRDVMLHAAKGLRNGDTR